MYSKINFYILYLNHKKKCELTCTSVPINPPLVLRNMEIVIQKIYFAMNALSGGRLGVQMC